MTTIPKTPERGAEADREQRVDRLAQAKTRHLAAEFLAFLGHNKKWWLAPLLVMLLL